MNLNIDNYGGKGVVPMFCGSYVSGTAFFVSPTHLLTAGHVLAEYYLDKGMRGDTGGGNEDTTFVYCYEITSTTVE